MSFRARTGPRRGDRSRDAGRRTLYTNIAFAAVLVVAVLILATAAAANYYGDHLAMVATVNGHTITKDDLRERYAIDSWRLDFIESEVRNAVQTGRLTKDQSDQQIASIEQQKQDTNTLISQSLQGLIDGELQTELAAQMGISVTSQQIDARLTQEATTAEARHLWIIEVAPSVTAPATAPTALQVAAAQTTANTALGRLKNGIAWETVAKVSTAADASSGGDHGFVEKDGSTIDPALLDALFALPANGMTDIVRGADGTFRIGRVTQIIPGSVNANYQLAITDAHISLDSYRKTTRYDLVRKALQDRIVADATTKPSLQRHVQQIVLTQQVDQNTGKPVLGDEVDVRHILYSPTSDPSAPAPPSSDPSWEVAHQRALIAYYELLKDPTKFAAMARRDSADTGSGANGGDLGYASQTAYVAPFADAIFQRGLTPNEILPPVLSQYGWHVIQFLDRRQPALTRMQGFTLELAKPGADFGAIAKANSEDPSATKGGDIGWVAPYQLDQALEAAIDRVAVGAVSDVVTSGNSVYLFKVIDEQTRLPDASQIETLKANAFQNWYTPERLKATITTDPAFTTSASGTGG
jgi:parvulin-like peptidyl-prolyl isomerase